MLIRFCSLINLKADLLNKFNIFVYINSLILFAWGRASNTRFGQFIHLDGANMIEVMICFLTLSFLALLNDEAVVLCPKKLTKWIPL